MEIQWTIKSFENLSVNELYDILKLRSEIFVVEQNCVYLDIDGKDKQALHLFGEFEGKIVGYSRLFKPGITFDNASIGRVVVDANYRDRKWGHDLMREAIAELRHLAVRRLAVGADHDWSAIVPEKILRKSRICPNQRNVSGRRYPAYRDEKGVIIF